MKTQYTSKEGNHLEWLNSPDEVIHGWVNTYIFLETCIPSILSRIIQSLFSSNVSQNKVSPMEARMKI
jgi:hypothetical protein